MSGQALSRRGALLGLIVGLAACTPVTLSNQGAIDFSRWRLVGVASLEGVSDSFRPYLLRRLRNESGFQDAVVAYEEGVTTDCLLFLRVSVTEEEDDEGAVDYRAEVRYRLEATRNGEVIDSGRLSDTATGYDSAVREGLDDVVLHYLRPYRF